MASLSTSICMTKESTAFQELGLVKETTSETCLLIAKKSQWQIIRESWYVLFTSVFISFGGFIFGYDIGTISGYVNMIDFLERFGMQSSVDPNIFYFTSSRVGLIISIISIGCVIGGLTLSKYADVGGRKRAIILGSIIYIVSIIIQITSLRSWIQIVIGRLVEGFAMGSISITCPMLVSESAPPNIRGICVFFYQLMIAIGNFVGYCVNYGTRSIDGPQLWRIPVGLCFAWGVILLAGAITVPESPRFLASQQRYNEALESLAKLNRTSVDSPQVKSEFDAIVAANEMERAIGSVPWNEIFVGKPKIFYRVLVGILVQTAQQLTGANYFFIYGTTIFKAVGLSDSYLTSIILGAVNLGATFIGLVVIDRYGRRVVCLVGTAGMFVGFVIYSILGTQKLFLEDGTSSVPVGNAMIFLTCICIAFFASTWGGISNVITAELFPGRVRSIGMSISIANLWLWNFITNFCTPFISSKIHFYYGFVYTGCLVGIFTFVYFFVYETKGLNLEEVDEMFTSGIPAWKSSTWKPTDKMIRDSSLSEA